MLCGRFILILMIALVSARPSPELSLEDIEKELEQLTAKENDASDATSKKTSEEATSTKEDAAKKTESEVPKELTANSREVPKEKLETLEKTVTGTEQKKDATDDTKADTDKKATDTSADPAAESSKKPDFKDTPAYRRLIASSNSHLPRPQFEFPRPGFPEIPLKRTDDYTKFDKLPAFPKPFHPDIPARRTYDYTKFDKLPSFPKPYHPDIPARRTYDYTKFDKLPSFPKSFYPDFPSRRTFDTSYRKQFDYPAHYQAVSDGTRGGFLPNLDPVEFSRGLPSEMDRAERMAKLSGGSWVPGSAPVKVPAVLAPADLPRFPDMTDRFSNDVHKQLNDKEANDLIHGKNGLTDAEKRKRYLMDQLAEKIKSKVNEAQKRGLKVPDKIIDFLWNYESRRGMDTKSNDLKQLLGH